LEIEHDRRIMGVVQQADLHALAAGSRSEWLCTQLGAQAQTHTGNSGTGSAIMQDTGSGDSHCGLTGTSTPGWGRQPGRSSPQFCTQAQTIHLKVFDQ
jgi:hypothetical protein